VGIWVRDGPLKLSEACVDVLEGGIHLVAKFAHVRQLIEGVGVAFVFHRYALRRAP